VSEAVVLATSTVVSRDLDRWCGDVGTFAAQTLGWELGKGGGNRKKLARTGQVSASEKGDESLREKRRGAEREAHSERSLPVAEGGTGSLLPTHHRPFCVKWGQLRARIDGRRKRL
jgi:hypothetical protein